MSFEEKQRLLNDRLAFRSMAEAVGVFIVVSIALLYSIVVVPKLGMRHFAGLQGLAIIFFVLAFFHLAYRVKVYIQGDEEEGEAS